MRIKGCLDDGEDGVWKNQYDNYINVEMIADIQLILKYPLFMNYFSPKPVQTLNKSRRFIQIVAHRAFILKSLVSLSKSRSTNTASFQVFGVVSDTLQSCEKQNQRWKYAVWADTEYPRCPLWQVSNAYQQLPHNIHFNRSCLAHRRTRQVTIFKCLSKKGQTTTWYLAPDKQSSNSGNLYILRNKSKYQFYRNPYF